MQRTPHSTWLSNVSWQPSICINTAQHNFTFLLSPPARMSPLWITDSTISRVAGRLWWVILLNITSIYEILPQRLFIVWGTLVEGLLAAFAWQHEAQRTECDQIKCDDSTITRETGCWSHWQIQCLKAYQISTMLNSGNATWSWPGTKSVLKVSTWHSSVSHWRYFWMKMGMLRKMRRKLWPTAV